jgi:hypothetical protein
MDTSFEYDFSRLDLHVYTKNLSKPNCWKRKPEPGIWKLQGSGLEKDVFGPRRFLKSEYELTLKKHEKNKKVCKRLEMGIQEEGRGEFRDSKSRSPGVNYCYSYNISHYVDEW